MSLTSAASRCWAVSLMAENTPMFDLSGGIWSFFSQVPFAYLSKSSPGFTDLSISDRSMPDCVPAAGCGCAWLLVLVLHAASARADATTTKSELLMQGPFEHCFANACRT